MAYLKEEEKRKKLIQLIHVGKVRLALDDESYRGMCEALTGKSSCKEMGEEELQKVLDKIKTLGFFVPQRKAGRRGRRKYDRYASREQLDYIQQLWQLAARNKSEEALQSFIMRIAHVSSTAFLTAKSATAVILALRTMAAQAGYDPDSIKGGTWAGVSS